MVPNPLEEDLLARITEEEGRWNDEDDAIADGWSRRLIDEEMPIWFEEKYNEDVASRVVVANPDMASTSARVPRTNFGRENVISKKVSKAGLVEMVYGLKQVLEDGLKEIHEKFESLDTRVKSLTKYVNIQREKEKRFENDGENDEENETEEAGETEEPNPDMVSASASEMEMTEAGEDGGKTEEAGEAEEAGETEEPNPDMVNASASEMEMKEAGEDGGKMLRTYNRKSRGKKQEGEPSEDGGKRKKKVEVAVRSPIMTRQKNKKV